MSEPVLHGEAVFAEDLIGAIEDTEQCACHGGLMIEVVVGDSTDDNGWFVEQLHTPGCDVLVRAQRLHLVR